MSKKITVTLDEIAERYFWQVNYGFDIPDGKGDFKHGSQSELISSVMQDCFIFEEIFGTSISGWLTENYPRQYEEELKKYNLHHTQHPLLIP